MRSDTILIIPDVHQDIDFLSRCLRVGIKNQVGEIILLGDLLDSKSRKGRLLPVIRDLLRRLTLLLENNEVPVTLLWGNHDWKYWAVRREIEPLGKEMRENFEFYALNDLSILTVDSLMEPHPENGRRAIELWGEHAVLAAERYGWLITHAGVHPSLWPQGKGLSEGVAQLNATMKTLVANPPANDSHPLLGAGPARGGFHKVGGPLWLDFTEEFFDGLPFPQIVGHTRCPDVLQNGRSFCLDACQQVCALLHSDGTLEPRIADEESFPAV